MFRDKVPAHKEQPEDVLPDDLCAAYDISRKGVKSFKIRLYEILNAPGTQRAYLDEIENRLVEEPQLKEWFGPGKYILYIMVDNRVATTRTYTIAGKKSEDVDGPRGSTLVQEIEKLALIGSALATTLKPFMEMFGQQKGGRVNDQIDKILDQYANSSMKRLQNLESQLIKNLNDKLTPTQEIKRVEQKSSLGGEIAMEIFSMVKKYADKIIDAGPLERRGIEAAVKADPEYRDHLEDADLLTQLYLKMCEDPSLGEDKARLLFAKLNLKYNPPEEGEMEDDESEQPEQPQPGAHPAVRTESPT